MQQPSLKVWPHGCKALLCLHPMGHASTSACHPKKARAPLPSDHGLESLTNGPVRRPRGHAATLRFDVRRRCSISWVTARSRWSARGNTVHGLPSRPLGVAQPCFLTTGVVPNPQSYACTWAAMQQQGIGKGLRRGAGSLPKLPRSFSICMACCCWCQLASTCGTPCDIGFLRTRWVC